MARTLLATWLLALLLAAPVTADTRWPEQGWEVVSTSLAYPELLEALRDAVEAEGMFIVTEAGPTEAAARRGESIPGNRVVGVFRNDFAVRTLRLSVPAMIEAPIRFYVTENEDGSATLSWKTPSHVLAPYVEEGGEALEKIGRELDAVFAAIASRAEEGAE
ncbi:DUF302 domain-containing protein [Halomonas sp. EGI 63088]|uniref:DUF302 domain-containing protein n=1 Tax=Halomonas flagellata TaxID=2920385 RepID=A0ABS9RRI4_9GAMM|nr:DUF302 domain-containing protein [Halomonas flagellata]MCH4562409.1 DUF302 domain-containing protein [Halomonas flagellata]